MSIFLSRLVVLAVVVLVLWNVSAVGQTNEIEAAQKVVTDAERYFRAGEQKWKENKYSEAKGLFDKAVEVYLYSSLKSDKENGLQTAYLDLIDRVFTLESKLREPKNQSLSQIPKPQPYCPQAEEVNAEVTKLSLNAIESYKAGDYEKTLTILRQLLANEPMNANAYLILGKIHVQRKDIDQAISSFKTALFWDNRLLEAHLMLGRIYYHRGDTIQARNYAVRAGEVDSNDKRTLTLSQLTNGNASVDSKNILENDSSFFTNLQKKLAGELQWGEMSSRDVALVMPFQTDSALDVLGHDFAYVLSLLLPASKVCVIRSEDRERVFDQYGVDSEETLTLASQLKIGLTSGSNLLVVGDYVKDAKGVIEVHARIIRVVDGRYQSEALLDGRSITREVILKDSLQDLRTIQGKVAYQILYQLDKANLKVSQGQLIDSATKIALPKRLGGVANRNPDFSVINSLRKTGCEENLADKVELRGLRLGMTIVDVLKLIPNAAVTTSNFEKTVLLDFQAKAPVPRFKDVQALGLRFFENQLYSIAIVYDAAIKWSSINEFASHIEKTLALPSTRSGGYTFDGRYLFCGNHQLKIMLAGRESGAIHFFDATVPQRINLKIAEQEKSKNQKLAEEEKRKQQAEEQKKKAFKP